ncbi:MAG: hypothetical protein JWM95_2042 [Gemmatimonadetes bacterium]|nr:hypothetical protein [Gemmatimonadota bacterium]
MNRMLVARLVLTATGILVWGYGQRTDLPQLRIAGIAILAVSLIMRFFVRKGTRDRD